MEINKGAGMGAYFSRVSRAGLSQAVTFKLRKLRPKFSRSSYSRGEGRMAWI